MPDIEPNFYLASDMISCPFDVIFYPVLNGSHFCSYTAIRADITITGPPTLPPSWSSGDIPTNITVNADTNLQCHKMWKLGSPGIPATFNSPPIQGNDVIPELIERKMVLIPFTINSWGHFGHMLCIQYNITGIEHGQT